MENHTDLVEELEGIVEELKQDSNNSSAAFRLFEISEHLLRGFINDFEVDYHGHDQDPTEDDKDESSETHQAPESEIPAKTGPYSVVNKIPSFSDMKKNINEWLEPVAEFETEHEAIKYLTESVGEGSVISTSWDIGIGEITYSVSAE